MASDINLAIFKPWPSDSQLRPYPTATPHYFTGKDSKS